MKRINIMFSYIIFLVMLTGCTSTKIGQDAETNDISDIPLPTESITNAVDNPGTTPTVTESTTQEIEENITIADYYPFKVNTRYVYEGEGNEYASYQVFVDYTEDNRIQMRTSNGGTDLVKVIENKDEKLTILLSRGECYYRENLIDNTNGDAEILLMEPLVKGTEWTLKDNRKRYISNDGVKITTPAGTFEALEVTTMGKEDKTVDYYAIEVGLVKTIFTSNGMDITSSLSKIEKNVPFTQTVKFFYPNVDEDIIYSVEKQLSYFTSDVTRTKLEEVYKEIVEEKFDPVLSPNVKINNLYLDTDNVVNVDFSKELVTEMNSGSTYEALILQCITNTLGNYYGVNEVYITVDGESYESGHILMKKGETFQVDLDKVIE